MAKVLSFIAPEGFQDVEYEESKKALEEAGHEVVTVSTEKIAHGKYEMEKSVDLLLDEIDPTTFDAILLVGGPGSHDFFDSSKLHNVVHAFHDANKVVSSICAAGSILANAGVLAGKKATCYQSEVDNIKAKGARYTGEHVEQDGNIITADGPDAAYDFGQAIAKELTK